MRTLTWAASQLETRPLRSRTRARTMGLQLASADDVLGIVTVTTTYDIPGSAYDVREDLAGVALSRIASGYVAECAADLDLGPAGYAAAMLARASRNLNELCADPLYHGLCGEAIIAVLTPRGAAIAWIGTARAYRVSGDGGIELLTRDHRLLDVWIDERTAAGARPTAAEIAAFPYGNVVTRVIGAADALASTIDIELAASDRLILVGASFGFDIEHYDPAELLVGLGGAPPSDIVLEVAHRAARRAPGHAIGVAAIQLA